MYKLVFHNNNIICGEYFYYGYPADKKLHIEEKLFMPQNQIVFAKNNKLQLPPLF